MLVNQVYAEESPSDTKRKGMHNKLKIPAADSGEPDVIRAASRGTQVIGWLNLPLL